MYGVTGVWELKEQPEGSFSESVERAIVRPLREAHGVRAAVESDAAGPRFVQLVIHADTEDALSRAAEAATELMREHFGEQLTGLPSMEHFQE